MRMSLLAALALCLAAQGRAGDGVFDLIIVAGQSNAVGFDARASDLPEDPRDAQVVLWWRGGDSPANAHDSSFDQAWVSLQPQPKGNPRPNDPGNFASDEGGFGPEMGLVRTLLDAQPDRRLAIVKVAYNATSIRAWLPAQNNLYRVLMDETKLAIAQAAERGVTLRPRALVWCQGETDANRNPDTDLYRERMETLIAAIRSDLDAPELIALLGFNTKFGRRWQSRTAPRANVASIRLAQIQVAERSIYVERVEDWGCEVVNSAHFGSEGTLEFGQRYANALLEAEAKLNR